MFELVICMNMNEDVTPHIENILPASHLQKRSAVFQKHERTRGRATGKCTTHASPVWHVYTILQVHTELQWNPEQELEFHIFTDPDFVSDYHYLVPASFVLTVGVHVKKEKWHVQKWQKEKRKADKKKCVFNKEWVEKNTFILPERSTRQMYLIWNETEARVNITALIHCSWTPDTMKFSKWILKPGRDCTTVSDRMCSVIFHCTTESIILHG